MSLAFLTPDAAPARALHARSPMERLALAAGARLSRVEGWNVPNAYDRPAVERERLTQTVAFADRSSLAKLEIQAPARTLAGVVARASGQGSVAQDGEQASTASLALAPGFAGQASIGGAAAAWWCPVTPERVLVLAEPRAAADVRAAVSVAAEELAGSATVSVVDVTCGLAALSLIGPSARELLARFCAIDVRPQSAPVAAFRPGSVARTPGYVLVEGGERLLVLVGWALGEYLWLLVADAAAQLGGGPVGAEALGRHVEGAADA